MGTAILRKAAICRGSLRVATWCLRLLRRIAVKLACWGTVFSPLCPRVKNAKLGGLLMTYAALQRPTIDVVATELADGARSVLVRIHFYKCKPSVGLETSLLNISEALK